MWNSKYIGLVSSSCFQHVKMLALHFRASTFRLWPLMIWGGCGLFCYPSSWVKPPSVPPNTHAFKPRRWHTIPTTLFETIWNGSVELVSSSPESPSCVFPTLKPVHFSVTPITHLPLFPHDSLPLWGVLRPPLSTLTCCLCCQAGLLGCEAVLSSMALMQANNIPGQKRMMSSLGQGHRASPESHQTQHGHHGHQVHHGQAHHSHMGHPSAGSCPPLVRERKSWTQSLRKPVYTWLL